MKLYSQIHMKQTPSVQNKIVCLKETLFNIFYFRLNLSICPKDKCLSYWAVCFIQEMYILEVFPRIFYNSMECFFFVKDLRSFQA